MSHTPVYWYQSTGTSYWYQKPVSLTWPLEYAALVWHSSLTTEQKDSLENVQKRAFLIIYREYFANCTCSYHEFCCEVGSLSLADRREGLSYNFSSSCYLSNSADFNSIDNHLASIDWLSFICDNPDAPGTWSAFIDAIFHIVSLQCESKKVSS